MLAWAFRVGVSTIGKIALQTCAASSGIYLTKPIEYEWKEVAELFYLKTTMRHVIGAVNGKYMQIKCPRESRINVLQL